ncbi:MAG: hypothetical protein ACREDZ_06110 [Kiloniellales bacterium]
MAGHPVDGGPERGDPNIIAMLSLNLLLLAFFILLNGLSALESQKVHAVMESVKQTFQGPSQSAVGPAGGEGGVATLPGGADALDRMARLFDSVTPLIERKETEYATVMRFALPASALFVSGRAELLPGRDLLLRRVAGVLLETTADRRNLELELLYKPESAAARGLAAGRVGLVARRLTSFDFEAANLAVSVVPAEDAGSGAAGGDALVFVIRLFERPQPAVDFAEIAEGGR